MNQQPTILSGEPATGFVAHPAYRLDFERSAELHQILFNEAVVAASDRAIIIHEQNKLPVVYFPPEDVDMKLLRPSDHQSHCPFKGDASYWQVTANGVATDDAAWSYRNPIAEAAPIGGYIAFYLDKMSCYLRGGVEQPLIGPSSCSNERPVAA